MSESLTEGGQVAAASTTEPTAQAPVTQPSAESQNQEAISGGQTQETAAATANQTNEGGSKADDSLAKFAKSQGIDLDSATENEKRLLKIASDNQKAYRSNQPKMTDVSKELGKPAEDASEVDKLTARVQQFEYQAKTDTFWNQPGKDKNMEATMVDVLKSKAEQFGKEYAYSLSQDLDTLYAMAQLESGNGNSSVTAEAARREERESINKSISAGAPQAHATSSAPTTTPKITQEWINTEYNSRNPEHVKLVDAFYQGR